MYSPTKAPELFTGRGNTGHEHLNEFGLINMNVRLYDPILGRFISPDPYVSCVDFLNCFNRYSYCLNNPLSYTDRSGKLILTTIITATLIGAAVGGVASVVIGYLNGSIQNMWDFGNAFITVAVTGFVGGAVGGVVTFVAGVASVVFVGGLTIGVASGFASSLVAEGINYSKTGQFSWNNVFWRTVISGAVSGLVSGVTASCSGKNFWTGKDIRANATPSPVTGNTLENVASDAQTGGRGVHGAPTTVDVTKGIPENHVQRIVAAEQEYYTPGSPVNYPANDGYVPGTESMTLFPKDFEILLDRYALEKDLLKTDTFLGSPCDPIPARFLPCKPSDYKEYQMYKVNQNIIVKSGTVAPAFGRPGGGVQFQILNPNNLNEVITIEKAIEMKLIVEFP
mgnify:CR=1 FL=1